MWIVSQTIRTTKKKLPPQLGRGHTRSCENNSSHPPLVWFGFKALFSSHKVCVCERETNINSLFSFFFFFLHPSSSGSRRLAWKIIWTAGWMSSLGCLQPPRPSEHVFFPSVPSTRSPLAHTAFRPQSLVHSKEPWELLHVRRTELREMLAQEAKNTDTDFILKSLPTPFNLFLQSALNTQALKRVK